MKSLVIVSSALLALAVVDAVCLKDMCNAAKAKCIDWHFDGAANCMIHCGRTSITCIEKCRENAVTAGEKACSPGECDMAFILKWGEKTYEYCID